MINFLNTLLAWYKANARDFPFRRTTDPYLIWLSEIIMQQTRIGQGVPYYDKFVRVFPTVEALAGASEEEVLKQWQGLGYYARARNLHSTAREVVEKYGGKFPQTFDGLRTLKGVGDYTAASIASVCYDQPHPVMDGNVIRFMTRYFGITGAVDKAGTKKEILSVLEELMSDVGCQTSDIPHPASCIKHTPSGTFNQAMIEFGATYCVPRNPDCNNCIFKTSCYALKHGMVNKLPLKKQPPPLKPRYFNYLVIRIKEKNGLYFWKRSGNDIWKGLYEFPLIETSKPVSLPGLLNSPEWKQLFGKTRVKILSRTKAKSHLLSHQNIIVTFCSLEIEKPLKKLGNLIRPQKINELPVPKIIERYLGEGIVNSH